MNGSRSTPGQRARKAVLPSGGLATRLLPLTKAVPKELLPVHDAPVIHHLLREAADAGLRDVLVVSVSGKEAINDYLDIEGGLVRGPGRATRRAHAELVELLGSAVVHTVRQAGPSGMGRAVLAAAEHVGREPFAVITGDELVDRDDNLVSHMIDVQARLGGIVLAVAEVADDRVSESDIVAAGEPTVDGLVPITDIVKNPAQDAAPSRLGLVGRYVLPAEIFDVLGDVRADGGGEVQLPDAMVMLQRAGVPVHAVRYRGGRHDVATTAGLLRSSVEFALRDPEARPALVSWLQERLATEAPVPVPLGAL